MPTRAELVEGFLQWQTDSPRWRWQLAFERLDTGVLIGSGGVRKASVDADSADVGFDLDSRHWGQGFATEGMARLVRFAFDEANLRRLTAAAVSTNQRSHRVLERLGFGCVETPPPGLGRDGHQWPDERHGFCLEAPQWVRVSSRKRGEGRKHSPGRAARTYR